MALAATHLPEIPPAFAQVGDIALRDDNAFGIVDKHLATREWMVGGAATIADFSLCGYLFYPLEESGYEVAGRYRQQLIF